MHLGDGLRQRQHVQGREADPIAFERNAVLHHRNEFGFLRIADAAVAQIELACRLLLGDQQTWRLREQFTQVVVDDSRNVVELRNGGFLRHRDQRAVDLAHDVFEFGPCVVAVFPYSHRLQGRSRLSRLIRENGCRKKAKHGNRSDDDRSA